MPRTIGLCYAYIDSDVRKRIIKAAPGFEVIDLGKDCTDEELGRCEVIFGRLDPKRISATQNLRWFHAETAGMDMYFKDGAALPESVILTSSSGAYGIAISEHLLTLAMMLMRRMPAYFVNQQNRVWRPEGKQKTIYGSDVTVVGLGDIGRNFAERAHHLGARVTAVTRTEKKERPPYIGRLFTTEELDEALRDADIVALCLPQTPETVRLLGRERFERMKDGAILLNAGRGSAIDEGALIGALESGRLGGAGLDVTSVEPLPKDSKLWGFPNVVLTPHISGADSVDLTLDLLVEKFIAYLEDYIAGRPFERTVDRSAGY